MSYPELRPGQILKISFSRNEGVAERFAVIALTPFMDGVDAPPFAMVAPLSTRVDLASDLDVVFSQSESPLGTPCMAEAWNLRPILDFCHAETHGDLDPFLLRRILAVHASLFKDVIVPSTWHGTPISSPQDPRLTFQREEFLLFSHLFPEPVDL